MLHWKQGYVGGGEDFPLLQAGGYDRKHLKPLKAPERYKLIVCEHLGCREGGKVLNLKSLDHFRKYVPSVYGVQRTA